jgi:non-heme chloroperoxidase
MDISLKSLEEAVSIRRQLASSQLVKNSTLKVYAGAPHGLTETHKALLNADLLAFLKT